MAHYIAADGKYYIYQYCDDKKCYPEVRISYNAAGAMVREVLETGLKKLPKSITLLTEQEIRCKAANDKTIKHTGDLM